MAYGTLTHHVAWNDDNAERKEVRGHTCLPPLGHGRLLRKPEWVFSLPSRWPFWEEHFAPSVRGKHQAFYKDPLKRPPFSWISKSISFPLTFRDTLNNTRWEMIDLASWKFKFELLPNSRLLFQGKIGRFSKGCGEPLTVTGCDCWLLFSIPWEMTVMMSHSGAWCLCVCLCARKRESLTHKGTLFFYYWCYHYLYLGEHSFSARCHIWDLCLG